MNGSLKISLLDRLKRGKKQRAEHLRNQIRIFIPHQIRMMRDQRGWTQKQLGDEAGKPQNVVSRLEDPAYASFTLKTLLELADAFDVALLVKFVPYSRYLDEFSDRSPDAISATSFDDELPALEARKARILCDLAEPAISSSNSEDGPQLKGASGISSSYRSVVVDDWRQEMNEESDEGSTRTLVCAGSEG